MPEEPAEDPSTAVAVAYVHQDTVDYSWYISMLQTVARDFLSEGRILRGGYVDIRHGTDGLPESRNRAVKEFLADRKADWLWWVDTDMGWEPDALDRLLDAADPGERPVVGALCFAQLETESDGMGGFRVRPAPTIYDWVKLPDGHQGFAVRWDYTRNCLTRCSGTGSACILIHRSVFERVREKYGENWYDRLLNPTTGQMVSEDLSLCMRIGAVDVPVFVHTGVLATHAKRHWVAEDDYLDSRLVEQVLKQATIEPAVREEKSSHGENRVAEPDPAAQAGA